MSNLGAYVLSLMLSGFSPWRSPHSLEECDPRKDAGQGCRWEPRFRPFDAVPGAFVRQETRESAVRRLRVVAEVFAEVALSRGTAGWREGEVDLSRAMVIASGWSTGFREDIQVGRIRGPGGEICLADMQIRTVRQILPELKNLPSKKILPLLAGRDRSTLHRCARALAEGLIRSRRWANVSCPTEIFGSTIRSTFAVYHMGNSCTTASLGWSWSPENKRYETMELYRLRGDVPIFPEWYRQDNGTDKK